LIDGSVIAASRIDLGAGNGIVPVEGGEGRNAAGSGGGEVARDGERNAGRWGKRVLGDDGGESGEGRGGRNGGE